MTEPSGEWFLYLIRLATGELYTGITTDIERRLTEHEKGTPRGARYLRGRGPLLLVFSQRVGDRSCALKTEAAVKKLARSKKELLVAGQIALAQIFPGEQPFDLS